MDTVQLCLIILPPACAAIGYILKTMFEHRTEKKKIKEKNKLDNIEYKLQEFYYPILSNLIRENSIWGKLIRISNESNTILCKSKSKTILSPSTNNPLLLSNDSESPSSPFTNNQLLFINDNNSSSPKKPLLVKQQSLSTLIDDDDLENNRITIELDKEILNIHLDNQKIIQNHLIKINPSLELRKALEKYDDHVTIFNILRKINPNVKNIHEMKYPGHFNAFYPVELMEIINKEYNKLIDEQEKIYNSKILV